MECFYMEKEIYLKKFFVDVYHDSSMYYDYTSGRLHIDKNAFVKWYSTLERRNDLFLNLLKKLQ